MQFNYKYDKYTKVSMIKDFREGRNKVNNVFINVAYLSMDKRRTIKNKIIKHSNT